MAAVALEQRRLRNPSLLERLLSIATTAAAAAAAAAKINRLHATMIRMSNDRVVMSMDVCMTTARATRDGPLRMHLGRTVAKQAESRHASSSRVVAADVRPDASKPTCALR